MLSSCAIAGFYGKFAVHFLGNFQIVFQNGGHYFAFLPVVMCEGSDFSTSSPIPATFFFFFDDSCSSGHEVVSRCGFSFASL